jgi:FeS assembly SUF system protein
MGEPDKASHVNRMFDQTMPDLETRIVESLRTIYDPEIPVNVYDLGLIYQINIDEANKVDVKMTLTAPNCPAAGILPGQVEGAVKSTEGVSEANVEIVWEPQWGRDMMSMGAALELGMI